MALLPLSSTPGYRLTFANQDWCGWPVHDDRDIPFGHVHELLVDTDVGVVVAVTLETGTQVPVDLVRPAEGRLLLISEWGATRAPAAFEPGQIEVREWAERVFAVPRPHVIEEVVVTTVAGERGATLRTTVARTEVTTELVRPSAANGMRGSEQSVEE